MGKSHNSIYSIHWVVIAALAGLGSVLAAQAQTGKLPTIYSPTPGQTNVPYVNFQSTGKWTDSATLGQIQLYQLLPGDPADTNNWMLVRERNNAATAGMNVALLAPARSYLIRYRNITARDDPWAQVIFSTAPDSAGRLRLTRLDDALVHLQCDGMTPQRALLLQSSVDLGLWEAILDFVPQTTATNLIVPRPPDASGWFRLQVAQ